MEGEIKLRSGQRDLCWLQLASGQAGQKKLWLTPSAACRSRREAAPAASFWSSNRPKMGWKGQRGGFEEVRSRNTLNCWSLCNSVSTASLAREEKGQDLGADNRAVGGSVHC